MDSDKRSGAEREAEAEALEVEYERWIASANAGQPCYPMSAAAIHHNAERLDADYAAEREAAALDSDKRGALFMAEREAFYTKRSAYLAAEAEAEVLVSGMYNATSAAEALRAWEAMREAQDHADDLYERWQS